MGKPRLVRITNRGSFPRWRLESVGSSSKRDKMDDATQGGWFGSGTKIAPVAALKLGMEVWVSSHDEKGSYLVTYGVKDGPGGSQDPRIVRLYQGGTQREDMTDFSPDSFPNWSKPIGDDDKREFRIWREYFRNGRDQDPHGPKLSFCDVPHVADEDATAVFLTRTDEYAAIMKDVDRYFKYLSNARPLFKFPGVGEIWPKSQEGATRMFSLGTMALCSVSEHWSTLFDYSFDKKELMSEERTFDNTAKVFGELAHMMANCPSDALALQLLRAIFEGRAELERLALSQLAHWKKIPAAKHWLAAWNALYGGDAVIEMGNWSDHHARLSFRRKPVRVGFADLRVFLTKCGVQRSIDVVPKALEGDFEVVRPTKQECAVLREALAMLLQRHPEMADVAVHVFEPRTEEMRLGIRGFVLPHDPPFTEAYIRRDRLQPGKDENGVTDPVRKAYRTLMHEFRHIRSGARDGTPELMNFADADQADMAFELRRREERGWVIAWDDLGKDETN